MAIKIPQGFKISSAEPIDSRLVLSKALMKNINDNIMPDHYIALCSDDNKLYVYDKSNEPSEDTGKFREMTSKLTEDVREIKEDIDEVQDWITEGALTEGEIKDIAK